MKSQMPILAASIAVFRGDAVLLVKRGSGAGKGLWSLPGGKVEWGETTEIAALRELAEETSVTAEIKAFAGLYEVIAPEIHYAIACYGALWLNGEPKANHDAAAARFVSKQDLDTLPLAPQTGKAIASAHALLSI